MAPRSVPVLQSVRVRLRVLAHDDGPQFVAGVQRSMDLHGSWVSPVRDLASFDAYLARAGETFVPLALLEREHGALAGIFNFSQIFMGHFCSAYLGYFAFAPYAGRGLMRDGLELVLQVAFEHLGLHRVEANIQPDNHASIALVRRAGFQKEGYSPGYLYIAGAWRDHERWAMRREVWSALRGPAR